MDSETVLTWAEKKRKTKEDSEITVRRKPRGSKTSEENSDERSKEMPGIQSSDSTKIIFAAEKLHAN